MLLLVTTSNSFLVLDSSTGKANVIEHAGKVCFGWIALAPDVLYVGVRDPIPLAEWDPGEGSGWLRIYNYNLQHVGTLRAPFPLRDMHQLHYHDGTLYITCCYDNLVAVYDGAAWSKWYPLPEHRDLDVNHFNSIFISDQRIHLMAHNLDREPSRIYVFDLATRELMQSFAFGHQAHNIWIDKGEYYACNSAHGTITTRHRWLVQHTGGMPRGIAVTPRQTFVGVSADAPREKREQTTAQLLTYDRRWRLRHRIILQDEGMIFEVRAPGVRDLCLPHVCGRRIRWRGDFPVQQFPLVIERRGFWNLAARLPAHRARG